jgi:hypothetical protein
MSFIFFPRQAMATCPIFKYVHIPAISFSYPFDVNEAILWLAELCDMVFVFFDPIGQALCKRTLNIVEKIRKARRQAHFAT